MAKETTPTEPTDFKAVLKEEAERYNLVENTLRNAVREQLTTWVARKIVEKIVTGEVAPPDKLKGGAF